MTIITTLAALPLRAQTGSARGTQRDVQPRQQTPAPALPKRGPLAPASERMLQFTRDGQLAQAAAVGRQEVALHPDAPRTVEHCKVLVQLAYAELLLNRREPAKAALATFDRQCGGVTVPPEFRAEAKRVHRVLAGEPVATVYPPPKP